MRRHHTFFAFWILLIAILIVAMLFLITGCSSKASSDQPTSSVGAYVNKEETIKANVTEDMIEIFLVADGSSALYWDGTWDPKKEAVTSTADREALDSSLFGSQDDSKKFKVTKNGIGFEMSMMGVTKSVVLRRAS